MIKTAFLLYSTTKDGELNVYYTSNSIPPRPFLVTPETSDDDPIAKILKQLNIESDSNRITYLGSINFLGISNDPEIDAIAIDVSSLNMKFFMETWKIKEHPAYMIGREDNIFILGLMMKLILNKKKLAERQENKEAENNKFL